MIKPNFDIPDKVKRIIDKYYPKKSKARYYYFTHVVKVTELALLIADLNPRLEINKKFVIKGAMLHDIGIIKTKAPEIGCKGKLPYICHTYLGREMLEKEGMKKVAPVCERHLGVGLSKKDIKQAGYPIPVRNMIPRSIEEKLICYADKFYSKSENHLLVPKPIEKINQKISKYGKEKIERFEEFVELFGLEFYNHLK
ncbi:MAG: HDIG domain-containing protein [Bacteroidales bacterium]|nr:HDIG domain-containing protein [Bacteroidales bacterium]MCF8404521.1 HDIG domain-containing protein [Bacteroidales bacterium]